MYKNIYFLSIEYLNANGNFLLNNACLLKYVKLTREINSRVCILYTYNKKKNFIITNIFIQFLTLYVNLDFILSFKLYPSSIKNFDSF